MAHRCAALGSVYARERERAWEVDGRDRLMDRTNVAKAMLVVEPMW